MPGPPSRVPRRLTILALLIAVGIGAAFMFNREATIVRTPDGAVFRLEGYNFRPGNVRYDFPNRPIARALAKVLPDSLEKRIGWLRTETTVFATPSFPQDARNCTQVHIGAPCPESCAAACG